MNVISFSKYIGKKLLWKFLEIKKISSSTQELFDITLLHQTKELQAKSINPLNAFGKKCFSQTDEDGITMEILRRINCLSNGVYAEFGVERGIENNTLVLAALGWKGFWVGGEDLLPKIKSSNKHFAYLKEWVTLENILVLIKMGLEQIQSERLDVISMDLDGNDIYFVEALLKAGFHPKLFIVEYNAKFPPPIEFKIAYDSNHTWQGDDYFGASLTSFDQLFIQFDYRLVCCNEQTGGNAFFVRNDYSEQFHDVPNDISDIYKEPRYWTYKRYGNPCSVRTIERILNHE